MKRILFVMVLCLALSMLFANGSAENAKAETIKIVLADINNAESIPGKTSQALADMINDAFLGVSVVVLGLVIWLVRMLLADPKGVIEERL